MQDIYLIPDKTAVTAKGDGPVVEIGELGNPVLLLQLHISGIAEQEAIDVSVFGGSDANSLGKSPIASFPQLFYRGDHPLLLDLTAQGDIKVLRAHWEVNRWGRGPEAPWFEISLKATEVPLELMRERQAQRQPST
jgi:hypothetical protein